MLGLTAEASLHAAAFDVYVLTGQSNSLGTTALDSSHTPGVHSADAQTSFFWSNVSASNTAYPPTLYGSSGGAITTLQVQQGDSGVNSVFWGPEIGFARAMADAGHANVMVIKASRGGGGNTLWSKAAFQSNPNSGHMYQHVLDTVRAAAADLTSDGHTFRIAGLMYLQGESDSEAEATLAGERFAQLLANLRTDLPNAANMHAVIGGIAASGSTRDLVRTRQSALALADATIDYFTNLDLADSLYDGLHFNMQAKLEIGRRYARRFRQAAGELPMVAPTGFAAVADAADATRVVFDAYVPDVDGPSPGINLIHAGDFRGFADGLNGQPRVGLLIDSFNDRVTFADRHPFAPSSDVMVGSVDAPMPPRVVANSLESDGLWEEGGKFVRFTFVDPLDTNRKATAASAAFELAFLGPEDHVTAIFLDIGGNVIHRTGELTTGAFGFVSRERLGGGELSNIHQIVFAGSAAASWTIGQARSLSGTDFAFQGFRVVPEPSGGGLCAVALVTICGGRRRWFWRKDAFAVCGY